MIQVTEYSATVDRARDFWPRIGEPIAATTGREPVATIHMTVMASGADLDKFMAMLAAVTGQAMPQPVTNPTPFGMAEIVPA